MIFNKKQLTPINTHQHFYCCLLLFIAVFTAIQSHSVPFKTIFYTDLFRFIPIFAAILSAINGNKRQFYAELKDTKRYQNEKAPKIHLTALNGIFTAVLTPVGNSLGLCRG